MALISIFMPGNVQRLGLTCTPPNRGMQLRYAIMTNHLFCILCLPIIRLISNKKCDQTQSPILATASVFHIPSKVSFMHRFTSN